MRIRKGKTILLKTNEGRVVPMNSKDCFDLGLTPSVSRPKFYY